MTRVEQDTTLEQASISILLDLIAREPISGPVTEEAQLTQDHVVEVVNSDEARLVRENLAALQAYFVSEGFFQLESELYHEPDI